MYFALSSNKKEFKKSMKEEKGEQFVPTRKVKNETRVMQLTSYGQISPVTEINVSFEVQGKLEKGFMLLKPGVKFSKGQLLYQVDNAEAFYTLSSRKSQFSNLILNALPDIEMDYPSEKKKWQDYLNKLKPNEKLPVLPEVNSQREKMFLTSRNIIAEYFNLKSAEARMEKYFYVAPFSGTVIEVYAEPGSIANPGSPIAKIAKTGDYEIKVPINLEDLEKFKAKHSASFTDAEGNKIGKGAILRISDVVNQRTQSADVFYSIQPEKNAMIYNGLFLNVILEEFSEVKTMPVPRLAVKEGKVLVLTNSSLSERSVIIRNSKPDTLFVTGLRDGEEVLLERTEIRKGITYKGIQR